MLSWARAYRSCGEIYAATVCLHRAFLVTFAMESSNAARTSALALAEDLAETLINLGLVRSAIVLMRRAAAWDHADPDRTVIAAPSPCHRDPSHSACMTVERALPQDTSIGDDVTTVFRRSTLGTTQARTLPVTRRDRSARAPARPQPAAPA